MGKITRMTSLLRIRSRRKRFVPAATSDLRGRFSPAPVEPVPVESVPVESPPAFGASGETTLTTNLASLPETRSSGLPASHAPVFPAYVQARSATPRVLILSASAGAGHVRAAEAVELALRQSIPEARVKNVDALQLTSKLFRHFYGQTYFDIVARAPHLVGYLYDRLDKAPPADWRERAKIALRRKVAFGQITGLLESEPWELIINTHFLPAEVVGSLRDSGRIQIPQVMVTTDYYVHAMWVKQPVERYFTATDEAAVALSDYVPSATIEATGIPIHPAFANPGEPEYCRRKHDLSTDRPIVLQLAGGKGFGPVEEVHRRLLSCHEPMHLVVATGRNAALKEKLDAIPCPARHRRTNLGFTTQMHELMSAAHVIVSKPGGLTTSEAMATGTPMVVVDPIPGQECRNSDYLLEQGAAIRVNALNTLPFKLDQLLADERRLEAMSQAARRIGRPHAAAEVVRRAMELARCRA